MVANCAVVLKESADMHLSRITAALRTNYLALFTCALVIIGASALAYVMVSMAMTSVRNYYALLPGSSKKIAAKKKAKNAGGDDVVYADDVLASGDASNLQDSDNNRIKASIKKIKGKYAAYNTAMTEYASRVRDREADNLMDEGILSRENDDFNYKKDGRGDGSRSTW